MMVTTLDERLSEVVFRAGVSEGSPRTQEKKDLRNDILGLGENRSLSGELEAVLSNRYCTAGVPVKSRFTVDEVDQGNQRS